MYGRTPTRTTRTALQRGEVHDVLRYWLGAIRLEEALAARPRAQRTRHAERAPRLDQPLPGQDYFKQPLDGALASLLADRATLERAFDGELCAFFEGWLHTQYRRGEDDGEASQLLCFPVLQLPRGELAGVLRAPVALQFATPTGQRFRVPSRRERGRGVYPEAPDKVRMVPAARKEGALPLFVDTRLLHNTLGVRTESIDALFEALRASEHVSEAEMLRLVTELLEKEAAPEGAEIAQIAAASPADLLARLTRAVQQLLHRHGSRCEAYGIAIVLDGTQAKTTWHLQRELVGLIEAEQGPALDSALGSYLAGAAPSQGRALQRAQFFGAAMTESQRAAAECFWGSTLSSVQGPPGTGKTTLILHLCAEALVRNLDALLDTGTPAEELLLIASSNNRAVDNVLDPLALPGSDQSLGLPLGLRAGSRQVLEHGLAGTLRQVLDWLGRAHSQPAPQRAAALQSALADFKALRTGLQALLAPRAQLFARERELASLQHELASLSPAAAPPDGLLALLSEPLAQSLSAACLALETRLLVLSRLCEAASHAPLRAVASQYGRMLKRVIPDFENALRDAQLQVSLPLPPAPLPDPDALLEAWEEASGRSLALVSGLREQLLARSVAQAGQRTRERLELSLRELTAPLVEDSEPAVDGLPLALFHAALTLREAWAAAHASELREAVGVALRCVESERSLRPFFRDEPGHAGWLRRLFPIWGSTLLSLGNCFPVELEGKTRVIIDEAGQCHPAHAVSALLRASVALVLGDVHQLTPVFELLPDDDERVVSAARLSLPRARLEPYRVHTQSHASTQALAEAAVAQRLVLVDHFRCQPEIIAVSDALCGYALKVHTAPASRVAQASFLTHAVCLVPVVGAQELWGGSYCNRAELSLTVAMVQALLRRGVLPHELAVITPYRGQLDVLRRTLRERQVPLEHSLELSDGDGAARRPDSGVALGTVHRFQGGERSIVLFSSVVSERRSLTFLDARPNLLNVAVSRARHHFICIGQRAVLAEGTRTRLLVEAAHVLSPGDFLDP